MAIKKSVKKSRTINQQLTSLEKLVRSGFRQTNARFRQVDKRFGQIDARFRQVDRQFGLVHLEFRDLRKEMNERFSVMEDRIDRLATHVDGFMKLHETLDIELTVMKQQMSRIEERLKRVEAAQAS
jgi:archaellum component FlaC